MNSLIYKYRWVVIVFVIILIYSQLIFLGKTANPDAQLLYPSLNSVEGLQDYFTKLFSFQLYDIQPVRDLSLFLDLIIYQKFNVNIVITQNVILWFLICISFDRLVSLIFPRISPSARFLTLLLFSCYPLSVTSVAWGIARKHLLSTFFILLATNEYLTTKSRFKISLYYFLSIFSQPISILWPFWVMIFHFFQKKSVKDIFILLLPCWILFALCFVLNWTYYEKSLVFSFIYNSKTSEIFEIEDKVLGLGHYFFQTFFPYWSTSSDELGDPSVLVGLAILVIFSLVLYKSHLQKEFIFSWMSFYLLPIILMLTNPKILSNTYLLIPIIGMSILLLALIRIEGKKSKKFSISVLIFCLFLGFYSYKETSFWKNQISYSYDRDFKRKPTCNNALQSLVKMYTIQGRAEKDLLDYIMRYECLSYRPAVAQGAYLLMLIKTQLVFFEDDFTPQQKEIELKKLSTLGVYPRLALAALYLKQSRLEEFEEIINLLPSSTAEINPYKDYLITSVLLPYCKQGQHKKCLEVIEPFTNTPDRFYL